MSGLELKTIAKIHTEFKEKFGIPRQSGIVEELCGKIIFEPQFRNADVIRGLEYSSHIWLIWEFSANKRDNWKATVRPPRLGGNKKLGVFATRSPFRPNPIGLSAVKIEKIELESKEGPVIYVKGADLMDGTPIFDIKPYIPYADCKPEALHPIFERQDISYQVNCKEEFLCNVTEDKRNALIEVLAQNPAPHYQHDPNKEYAFEFGRYHITFKVSDTTITVTSITD